jgi:hypothetical protein
MPEARPEAGRGESLRFARETLRFIQGDMKVLINRN